MKRNLYSKVIRIIAMTIVLCCAWPSFAQHNPWKQVHKLPATNAFFITENGNMLLADYLFDLSGGIYVSTNNGGTWEKCAVEDRNYNIFIENDGYIFAGGYGGSIARSDDNGLTWELFNYGPAVVDLLGENLDYTVCYAMTMHDGKLFAGDFSGGGIIYSEDNGETWNKTDVAPLSYEVEGKPCVENIYNLVSYNGDLYAFGVFMILKYIPEQNSWELLREDSNFMAVSTFYNGMLCTGRSVMNDNENAAFIETLNEEGVWGQLPRPETVDNNIRAIYADGKDLLVGMGMSGLYYTDDAGETWYTLNDGIPYASGTYFTPMFFQSDEDFIYLAAYEPDFATTENSGLYRLAKADLPTCEPGENNLPDAPEVTAEAISATEIELTWNAVETATSYNIYLENELLASVTETTWVAQGLIHSTDYCFEVAAVNDFGESDRTEACAKTLYDDTVNELELAFNIYPNPVENEIFVEADANIEEVCIYTLTGVLVVQQSTVNGQKSLGINVSELNSGAYLVKVRTNDGVTVRNFIKK
ncbi:MAG: T9SS type A sorting domain-containing protein [Bacteroidales bacterium]|nr:T9SS type A sorting domain-containing protein [Bacteroidales bacterium]